MLVGAWNFKEVSLKPIKGTLCTCCVMKVQLKLYCNQTKVSNGFNSFTIKLDWNCLAVHFFQNICVVGRLW